MAKIQFTPPKGYQPPEDVAEDADFDESATFKFEGDKLCLVAIGGVPLPGYEDEKGKKAEAPKDSFAQRVSASMMPQGPPAGMPQGGGY